MRCWRATSGMESYSQATPPVRSCDTRQPVADFRTTLCVGARKEDGDTEITRTNADRTIPFATLRTDVSQYLVVPQSLQGRRQRVMRPSGCLREYGIFVF